MNRPLFKIVYRTSANTTRTTIEPAPQEKHANFLFFEEIMLKERNYRTRGPIVRGLYLFFPLFLMKL